MICYVHYCEIWPPRNILRSSLNPKNNVTKGFNVRWVIKQNAFRARKQFWKRSQPEIGKTVKAGTVTSTEARLVYLCHMECAGIATAAPKS